MADIRVGCPLCGRVAKTSAELLALGCEGMHERLVALSDVEPLVEAAQECMTQMRYRRSKVENKPLAPREARLQAALKPFEDAR